MNDNLKILIVDDSVTYRQIMSDIISGMKNVELVGTASNGKIALSKIESHKPDLVLLDVNMPVMDGIETLQEIKKKHQDVDVIMVSSMDKENANLTVKALEFGALDFISKPKGTSSKESITAIQTTLSFLLSIAKTKKYSRQVRKASLGDIKEIRKSNELNIEKLIYNPQKAPKSFNKYQIKKIDVVALGVSTGGPNALSEIIPKIEKNLPVPILAVQHMPPTFTASLAERLDKISQIRVFEGKDNEIIENGAMYIAPGGNHMVIRKSENNIIRIGLVDSPPVKSCKPSVDVLFRSIGMVYGGNVLSVILTGMGNDGAQGVSMIHRKGGYSIIQDEKTSVVWGMPGSVYEANDADEVLPMDKIANRIMEIVWKGHI